MPPDVAEMIEVRPAVRIVAKPPELIVAAVVLEDAHVTNVVMSLLLLSE
jgi:hypothetical protein